MKLKSIGIKNFRRLVDVKIDTEDDQTVFVGPNNSGKTSATTIFRCFLGGKDFKIHDFSVSKIENINSFGNIDNKCIEKAQLPTIELDLWFSINSDNIDFGRAFILLPELSDEFNLVGVRLKYGVRDPEKMQAAYAASYPKEDNGTRKKTLSQFLGLDHNLRQHFEISYYSLDSRNKDNETRLENSAGKALLKELVRIDYVDAQRNIEDEEGIRSNRLSTAFTTFYKKNLEQAEVAEEAHLVIDENNKKLTEHYDKHFSELLSVIKSFGVSSINDRELKLVSSLSPETALQGNTDLLYIDSNRNHELPEAYNGLGFKNLIYMAIQVSHFHLQWMRTENNRPLCQLIFIEEPEVHLHAQVQQTFITNVSEIISTASQEAGNESLFPQFLVTTHSSHILDAVDFSKVRHFQRCLLEGEDRDSVKILNASKVQNLGEFNPKSAQIDSKDIRKQKALDFLRRYLKLTHCDLFFADAAILVEGTVEKLLLPKMIKDSTPNLGSKYLSILEVGGAYSHRFSGLLNFLRIPYLVITDLDSVKKGDKHSVCRGDTYNAETSNASLKAFFGVNTVAGLVELSSDQKIDTDQDRCVAFQTKIQIAEGDSKLEVTPRTFEEAFVFENLELLKKNKLALELSGPINLTNVYEKVYQRIKSSSFKKTEFALNVLSLKENWNTPDYIFKGLEWLDKRLSDKSNNMT